MQQETGTRSQVTRAAIASTIGTSIEWYDFFLYGSAAALVFPKLFFPKSDPLAGALISFASLSVGFADRPGGAAVLWHYRDRLGRKGPLLITLLGIGLGTTAVGLL